MVKGILDVHVDHRIGGVPVYYLAPVGRRLMRVPDQVRKCVAFLGFEKGDKFVLAGTVFFVGMPLTETRHYVYAVTAKHVIEGIMNAQPETRIGEISFRINTYNDGLIRFLTDENDWKYHPTDKSVDVAAIPIRIPGPWDHMIYPTSSFATPKIIEKESIGLGEEVFLTGLFRPHSGSKRNIPIVRAGNIAAMPEEPVNTQWHSGIEAYLIEARSINGLSGSPVFVHLGYVRNVDGNYMVHESPHGQFYLLGLMQGHWNFPQDQTEDSIFDDQLSSPLNMGIGVVVPAEKILEVINQPVFQQMREDERQRLLHEQAATPDASIEKDSD